MKLILLSIFIFSALIMLLAYGLMVAKKKLLPQGDVSISVNNGEKVLELKPGATLLTALSTDNIFLPSACGGGGTCAMCKCQVNSGGGDPLSTEMNHLTRKEAADNWRLACQVKVRNDMEVEVPAEIFGIKKWDCEVVSNYNVATFIKEFVVKVPEPVSFVAGGYIQIDVPSITIDYKDMNIDSHPRMGKEKDEFEGEWNTLGMRQFKMVNEEPIFRAYSMANHPKEAEEQQIIMLNIRVAPPPPIFHMVDGKRQFKEYMDVNPGICSSYVFGCQPGDKVTISGPYGEFHIKPTKKEMVYIGGGAGMAPLRSHLFHLFHTLKTRDRKVCYWYGGRAPRELFYIDDFRQIEAEFDNFTFFITIDRDPNDPNWIAKKDLNDQDGNCFFGFVMPELKKHYLDHHPEPEEIEYYFCGPPAMAGSIFSALDDLGVPKENIAFDDFGE
ncbi:MAG: NADH:ubiquinone reductase (Na(+)-transporting) subunit F [Saprospiraceae bacterium]|nr:NADH:ubiquinone reductase (Na(+)-transporting) subunit F [Saprospiraceae bacterium]